MKGKKKSKVMIDFRDEVEEKGIVVVDNISEMPIYGEPYISKDFVYCICHSGHLDAEYDTHTIRYSPQDVTILYPMHVILAESATEDYRSTLVVVSEKKFQKQIGRLTYRSKFRYEQAPGFHLSREQYDDVMCIVNAMRVVNRIALPSRVTMLDNLMEVLLQLTDHFRSLSGLEPVFAPQKLSARYIETVIEHHRKEHSVSFYANELCLSPKYFSNIIKQETGKSAKYWITYYIMVEAKLLLRTRPDMNIQEIGDYLGFDDQTSFCRTFKKFLGVTPTEYRSDFK